MLGCEGKGGQASGANEMQSRFSSFQGMGGWGGAPHLSDISAALVPTPEPGMVTGKSGSGAGEVGGWLGWAGALS